MTKILFLTLITTFLLADNPKAFSAIGNPIYNNAPKILNLKHIPQYKQFEIKIDNYYFDVDDVKDRGFEIDAGKKSINSREYLNRLRSLIKTNDFFVKMANVSFNSSMQKSDSQLFSDIINTGLIDTKKHKKEIVRYYMKHTDEIDPKGIIQQFLDEDEKLRREAQARRDAIPTKKKLLEAKVRRIKAKDEARKIAREKALQQELEEKKLDIRKKQKKELSY